jgi:hypothetical protein
LSDVEKGTPTYAIFRLFTPYLVGVWHTENKGVCQMISKIETQRTLQVFSAVDDYLFNWLEAFLIDRKAGGLAEGTLRFHRQKIKLFSD